MRSGLRIRPWAGIDVGDWSIKLVAAMGSRHRTAETRVTVPAQERDTPSGHERVAKLIAECMEQTGLGPRGFGGITMGIAGPDVILKQITLPYMDEDEIGPALQFEARKHLPFDPQGMVIDYQLVGRSITERRLDVLLAAVTQERLDRHMAPLRLLGLDADIVDAVPLAVTNALLQGMAVWPGTLMLLDLGHTASHLILYHRTEPYFARRIEFGGKSITQAVARGMKIAFEDAEAWILSLDGGRADTRIDWNLPEMKLVLEVLRLDLLEDIKRSVAFYRTIGKLNEPFSLWISGGAARLPGLAERLAELLEVQVRVFTPLASPDGKSEADGLPAYAPQLAQAFGLALRAA